MAKKEEAGQKVLGYAKFGAFMHRNNGGKMNISAYTSVNKPLTVDTSDETVRIAERTYKIVEDERPEIDGNKFYSKDVWNEQSGQGDTYSNSTTTPTTNENVNNKDEKSKDGLTPLQVLKNFVDNIASDNRAQWVVMVAIAIIAAAAIVVALVK